MHGIGSCQSEAPTEIVMKTGSSPLLRRGACLVPLVLASLATAALGAEDPTPHVGIAVRDITPTPPIRLAGYAGRNRPADKVDHPLLVQALALQNATGERFVFVALDNCEVSRAFMQPLLQQFADKFQLRPGQVAVVSSHTHSAPVLDQTLTDMAQPLPADREVIEKYSRLLQTQLVEAIGAALADLQPAQLKEAWAAPRSP